MINNKRQAKRKLHYGRIIACLAMIIVVGTGILYYIQQYNNPDMFGKWQSEQTKNTVEFHENGTVTLGNSDSIPQFSIISSNKMNYTIDGKVFEMYYHIDGRKLYWGQSEQVFETFIRK